MKRRDLFLVVLAAVLGCLVTPPRASAQSAPADWEKAAGGKMAFEVASVKLNKSGTQVLSTSDFPLNSSDAYSHNDGLLSATNRALIIYIDFAYKLDPGQTVALMSKLPDWAKQERFDIQAKADGNPTKDQMRLMMQSLLADRFKLETRIETRREPVYALAVDKPGKLGPQIMKRSPDVECHSAEAITPPDSVPAALAQDIRGFPVACGDVNGLVPIPGTFCWIGHDFTAGLLASWLTSPVTGLNRSVIDQSGISGSFDFILYWDRGVSTDTESDEAPPFTDALKNQLGLKLVATTGLVNTLVIDHIEEPTAN